MAHTKESCCLLVLVLLCLCWSCSVEGSRWSLAKEENLEIEKQLSLLNKPYIKSFKTKHGDIFDCVDIYKQPALDHPMLQNHKIQMKPSILPQSINTEHSSRKKFLRPIFKEKCPKGSVLIRRTVKEDLISTQKYAPEFDISDGNHYAGIVIAVGDENYYGVEALLDVYNVQNVSIGQASTAQIIISNGETGPILNQKIIQFGWHVFPSVTGDNQVRLFTYWTFDGYQNSGCYNTICPGFVLTGSKWTPGMVIPADTSSIKLKAYKDQSTGDWWLAVGEDEEPIGYWPEALFNHSFTGITEIQMGGIAYSPFDEPSPPMCNGVLPDSNDPLHSPDACKFKQIQVRNGKWSFVYPESILVSAASDITDYYNVASYMYDGPSNGFVFSFGGPGGYQRA